MLSRIIVCLCHPKKIGTFFKDKVWMVILTILLMFILYLGATAAYVFQCDYFTEYDTRAITQLIIDNDATDIQFDSAAHKLTGSSTIIKTKSKTAENYFTLNYFPTEEVKYSKYFTLVFTNDDVSVYYGNILLSQEKLSKVTGINSYSLENVRKCISSDTLSFEYQINGLLDTCNMKYGLLYFLNCLIRAVIFYLGIVLVAFIFSRFYNPTIDGGVRFKLSCYSSLIFLFVELLGILFDASWITWIGVILAVFYSVRTFTHILKKKSV